MGLDAQFHVYTEPFAHEPPTCPFTFCSENLLELALPLEAEGPVDNELPAEREKGHTDGSARYMSDHFALYPVNPRAAWRMQTYPRTTTAGQVSIRLSGWIAGEAAYSKAKSRWECS